MKDKLTPEQSQRLIVLDVDPSKASEKFKAYEPIDANYRWESEVPIFRFTDLLELLPKEIILSFTTMTCRLILEWMPTMKKWHGAYKHIEKEWLAASFIRDEPIDALYELLVWCITNKYLKI